MCWKKQKIDVFLPSKKRALLFAINDYIGSANDLNGCLNDQNELELLLSTAYNDFEIRKYSDSQVTRRMFKGVLDNAISVLRSGDVLLVHYSGHGTQVYDKHGDEEDGYDEALYLHDGELIDDDINMSLQKIPDGAVVVLALDSCYSGTATRKANGTRNRFIQTRQPRKKIRKGIAKGMGNIKWVVFSGCMEDQTSADALIGNHYNGAFTYFWLQSFQVSLTYRQWLEKTKEALSNAKFDQIPTLEGETMLLDRVIFT